MVDSFLTYLQYQKRYSEHTLISYRNDLSQLEAYLNRNTHPTPIAQATFFELRGWLASLSDAGLSPSSLTRKMACLRSFYKFLLQNEVITQNPMQKIKGPRLPKRTPVFVPENKIVNLLDGLLENENPSLKFSEDFSGIRDKLLLEMLYGTGIRLSEMIGLHEADVDVYNQTIKVVGKRNKERLVPIHKTLLPLIAQYRTIKKASFEGTASDSFLLTDNGEECYPMFIYRRVKHYLSALHLDKESPHVLRHTFATHLLNKGADLNAIKDLLGHESLAATQVYTHNSLEKMKEAFKMAHPKAEKKT
jgi:integrase/recombinase XerC